MRNGAQIGSNNLDAEFNPFVGWMFVLQHIRYKISQMPGWRMRSISVYHCIVYEHEKIKLSTEQVLQTRVYKEEQNFAFDYYFHAMSIIMQYRRRVLFLAFWSILPHKWRISVILWNQPISVSSQTQFFEIISSESVVKISFVKYFLRWMEWSALMLGIQF